MKKHKIIKVNISWLMNDNLTDTLQDQKSLISDLQVENEQLKQGFAYCLEQLLDKEKNLEN